MHRIIEINMFIFGEYVKIIELPKSKIITQYGNLH